MQQGHETQPLVRKRKLCMLARALTEPSILPVRCLFHQQCQERVKITSPGKVGVCSDGVPQVTDPTLNTRISRNRATVARMSPIIGLQAPRSPPGSSDSGRYNNGDYYELEEV
jgi:hypothetical protein